MKLHLIAGHGHGDSGAVGFGYTEAERVRALCARIKAIGGDNVVYHDPSHDYYAEDLFKTLNVPSSDCMVEVHMDGATPSARGGHVVIWKDYEPDSYDTALANFISNMFAGRSQSIVKRGDLKNCMLSDKMNINYRLLEVCFITNESDLQKFNANIDTIARGILKCFGIGESVPQTPKPTVTQAVATTKLDNAKSFDKAYSKNYTVNSPEGLNLRVGAGTNKGVIVVIPNGTQARCFGYYTSVGNTKWLCVNVVVNGKTYTGYCSSDYLK